MCKLSFTKAQFLCVKVLSSLQPRKQWTVKMSKYPHVTDICSPGQLKQSSDGSLDGVQRPPLHFRSPRSACGTTDARGQAPVSLSTKTSHVPQQSGACCSFTVLLGPSECRRKLYPSPFLPPWFVSVSHPLRLEKGRIRLSEPEVAYNTHK